MYKLVCLGKHFPKSNRKKKKNIVWIYVIDNDATNPSSSEDANCSKPSEETS